jgi:acyl carrier protein
MNELTIAEIKTRLKEIIVNDLEVNIDPSDITDQVSLYDEGLGLDSIAIVNFIVTIEARFNFSFDESEISSKLFGNIETLAEFIDSKINSKVSRIPG